MTATVEIVGVGWTPRAELVRMKGHAFQLWTPGLLQLSFL